jgi:hypothetical protein
MEEDKRLLLMGGRFVVVNAEDRINIFDVWKPKVSGCRIALGTIPVKTAQSPDAACLHALDWLCDQRHITSLEYFEEAGKLFTKTGVRTLDLPKRGRRKRRRKAVPQEISAAAARRG